MLIDLQSFKNLLGDDTMNDEQLTAILDNAIGVAEGFIGRQLEEKNYEYEMDGNGERIVIFKHFPLLGDFSFKIHGEEVDKSRYHLLRELGMARFHNEQVPRGFGIISVSYSAGYNADTLPRDLKNAILQIACKMKNLGNSGIKKERVDGTEIEFFENNSPISPDIERILTNYRQYNA